MLRKLIPKDAAKLFSRLCNQFRHTDIVSNHELMRILEYNPKQITRIVQIKHQFHCDSLDKIVKAYTTKNNLNQKQKQKQKSRHSLSQKSRHSVHDSNESYHEGGTHTQPHHGQHASAQSGSMSAMSQHSMAQMNQMQMNVNRQQRNKQMLMEKYLPSANARVLWSETRHAETATFDEMSRILLTELREKVTFNKRPLPEHSEFLDAFRKFGGQRTSESLIQIQFFNTLYEWFAGIVAMVSALTEDVWTHTLPMAIAGFIGRHETERALQRAKSGAFLIRFSYSALRSIVISYRVGKKIIHTRGVLRGGGLFLFNTDLGHYETGLASFVQKFEKITALWCVRGRKLHPKADVYFGPALEAQTMQAQQQQMHMQYGQQMHAQQGYGQYGMMGMNVQQMANLNMGVNNHSSHNLNLSAQQQHMQHAQQQPQPQQHVQLHQQYNHYSSGSSSHGVNVANGVNGGGGSGYM